MGLRSKSGALPLLGIGAQLAVLLLLVRLLQIEPASGLLRILPLIFGGFLVHSLLPLRYRHAFFLLLSFAAIALVLGPWHGGLLVIAGLALFGIAHLPVAFSARVLLLLITASLLAALRTGWVPGFINAMPAHEALPKYVLPALASMFMFRMIIYLYDLRHEERERARGVQRGTPATIFERLSYFFMLPNICFLLFPLIDYRTFRRTYYDREAVDIYQQGVWWMCLGLINLLLYRLVYHYLVPAPDQLHGLAGVSRFLIASYLIYFRVLGQFHFIAGILCLFGYDVPPAHRLLFMASSFTDFWRRARIEWKDFMVKVFYYPAVVPMQRKWGATVSMVVATIFVFIATWLLHSYQWFWLRGEVRLSRADGVFWAVFGSCVLVNMLLEARGKRQRAARKEWALGTSLVHSLKVLGIFVFLCALWSYWSSPSFGVWWSIISAARDSTLDAYIVLLAGLAGALALGSLAQLGVARIDAVRPVNQPGWPLPGWRPLAVGTVASLLFLIGVPASRGTLGAGTQEIALQLRSNKLNQADQERNDRGYYETLLDEPRGTGFLANGEVRSDGVKEVASKNGSSASGKGRLQRVGPLAGQAFVQQTSGVLGYELKPSFDGFYKDAPFTTNRWGMRDKEYGLAAPPNTYRIAWLGSSYTMAGGVSIEESVEGILENRLNREGPGAPAHKYEILNFSVGGYGILQNVAVAEQKVFQFKPNAVVVMIHNESGRMAIYLINLLKEHVAIEYPYVRDKLKEAGITDDMQQPEMRRLIMPIADDLVRWGYRRIAELGNQHGVPVVGVIFPAPVEAEDWGLVTASALASEAGISVITLQGAYDGHDLATLRLEAGDVHLNAAGHKLAADQLFKVLRDNDARALKLGFRK